jgi:hypothetical protein
MLKKYTKGDKNKVVTRIDQVSSITLNVPTSDRGMDYLYDALISLCSHYVDENDGDKFLYIPALDFYNIVIYVDKCCKEKEVNTDYIFSMMGVVRTFENLKYISVIFSDNMEVRDSYEILSNIDSDGDVNDVLNELTNIYLIDTIEMYLVDMLDQKIIDLINKHLMSNGIISNSYLEREFLIEFEFEEYISYINMFIENNIDRLSMLDEDIMDYLRVFPSIIGDIAKPNIKLYTNYREV